MASFTVELPTMYADHHVVEVRRLLFELTGVKDVYASSAFHVVDVDYDEAKLDAEAITSALDKAGYLGEMPVAVEVGAGKAKGNGSKAFFRHTAAFTQTGTTVGFAQKVPETGRPLWPCPGMGVIQKDEEY